MPEEEVQELGREGVGQVKAWLEATTWLNLPFNAYQDGPRCKIVHHAGVKKFDLRGAFLGGKKRRRLATVECKRYTTTGKQASEFQNFLAIAYSSTHKQRLELREDPQEDFLWVTSHPFSQTDWPKLLDHERLAQHLSEPANAAFLGGHSLDEELVRKVVKRIWLLVWSQKQLKITLTSDEVKQVMTVLNRGGESLWRP